MLVSDRIRKERKNKGLSQKELARQTGIAEITIRGYENNKFKPKIEQLDKISKVLNIRTEYLLGITKKPQAAVEVVCGDLALNSEYLYLADERFIEKLKKDYPNIEINVHEGGRISVAASEHADLAPMKRARLIYSFNMLNYEGQKKALEYVDDLTRISNYRERVDENAEKD